MEYQSDNFVTYTETTAPPNESFPDLDFMLQSPFTDTSGGQSYSHESNSYFQNHSVSHQSFGSPYASPEDPRVNKVQKRRQKTGNPENDYTVGENPEKNMIELSSNSKKIQKRNKAKARAKIKQNMAMVMTTAPEKYIPSGIDDPNLDDKTKRKMIQMAKNRMAAQKTRDRKKQYASELEEVKNHLAQVNAELEEKNRLLEERIKALERNQVYLLQENQDLKKNQFMEAFYQTNVETVPSSIDTGSGFDSNSEYKSLPSPGGLSRRSSRGTNNYFNFFLGVIAICAVYTGINIKIGQETENIPDPFKDQIEEWTMEGSHQPEIMRSEVEHAVEEPSAARTFGKSKPRSKKGDEETVSTFSTFSKSDIVPGPRTAEEPAIAMATMSLTVADDSQDFAGSYGDDGDAVYDAQPMMAASLFAMRDDGRVYQPKTPMKQKWEYISEILTLHTVRSYYWDAPGYVWEEPPMPVSIEMGADYGEYDSSEFVFLDVSHNVDDQVTGDLNQEVTSLNVNSTEYERPEDNKKRLNRKQKKISQELDDDNQAPYGFAEGSRGLDENMAVQAA